MTSLGCCASSLSDDKNGRVVTLLGDIVMAKAAAMTADANNLPPHSQGCDLLYALEAYSSSRIL